MQAGTRAASSNSSSSSELRCAVCRNADLQRPSQQHLPTDLDSSARSTREQRTNSIPRTTVYDRPASAYTNSPHHEPSTQPGTTIAKQMSRKAPKMRSSNPTSREKGKRRNHERQPRAKLEYRPTSRQTKAHALELTWRWPRPRSTSRRSPLPPAARRLLSTSVGWVRAHMRTHTHTARTRI